MFDGLMSHRTLVGWGHSSWAQKVVSDTVADHAFYLAVMLVRSILLLHAEVPPSRVSRVLLMLQCTVYQACEYYCINQQFVVCRLDCDSNKQLSHLRLIKSTVSGKAN